MRRRSLAVAGLVAIAVLGTAAPALAHAQLLSTEPVGGTSGDAPRRVVLHFSEPVSIPTGAVRIYDSGAERVTTAPAGHPRGDSRSVSLDLPELERGGYVVTWRVTSADSHPVHGAFTFRVGPAPAGAEDQALARRLLAAQGGSPALGAVYAVVRFVAFASLVVLVGGGAFLVLVWPAGAAAGRARRLLWTAWAGAFAATVVGLPVQAATAAGLPVGQALSGLVAADVFGTRFGQVWTARLVLLALAVPLLLALRKGVPWSRGGLLAGGVLGAGLLLTPGLAGHAATRNLVPVAEASDLVHLASVSLWLGGIVVLVACVLPRGRADELAAAVPRFSRLAFGAVIAIVVTGLFQAWREVGGPVALTTTTYGRLLMVKVAVFVALVGLGAVSRRWVHARYGVPAVRLSPGPGAATAGGDATEVARLRRAVGAEAALAAVVLAVTALLVNAEPARSAVARPYSTELTAQGLLVDVTLDPAKAGPADLHVYTLSPEGAVKDVAELTAALRLPERDVGPLRIPLEHVAPGHFSAYGFELPLRGRWELEVVARLDEFDEVRASTTVPVR